jgi:hypothetical protein
LREVHLSDLTVAARALLAVPPCLRTCLCVRLFDEADCADKFTKRMGKPHTNWGNGTLMAAARSRKILPERAFSDHEYASCIVLILQSLQHHRAAKACKSRLHAHIKN